MTTPLSILALYTKQTAEEWLDYGLSLAEIVGLPVSSWRTGDPTKSLYKFLAEALATLENQTAEYIKGGHLSLAEGEWKTVHASEVYGVEREEETYATPTVTITNGGGGFYPLAAGDLIVQASSTGKTYHNTDVHEDPGDVLSGGATVTFQLVADEGGSGSSVAVDEIDTIVSPALLGCTIDSSTAATGQDEQDDESLQAECEDSRGALSPNGPADAYSYVVKNSALTGSTEITRTQVIEDSGDGTVIVYVAGPSGPVTAGAITAAQGAIEIWAEPLTAGGTVTNSTGSAQALTYTITGEDLPADWEDLAEAAFGSYLATVDIGGLIVVSKLYKALEDAIPDAESITITVPAANVNLADGVVPTAGTVTGTEV